MADKSTENVEVAAKDEEVKEKEVAKSPAKDDSNNEEDDKTNKENGDVCETKNGKTDSVDDVEDVDAKESEACPVKRKSAGGDAAEGTPAEGASPEKKAKLNETSADAESNGEAEVAA